MSDSDFDAIIVGQGLAGTALAWNLIWRQKRVLVIDRNDPVTSSRVAAGLMTPITGKKLVPSWQWHRFWCAATQFYHRVEEQTASSFFYPQHIVRLLATSYEQQYFAKRLGTEFVGLVQQAVPPVSSKVFDDSLGGFEMVEGGRLAVPVFLTVSRDYFHRAGAVITSSLDLESDVELTPNGVRIPRLAVTGRHLIFCQGVDATSNPWFRGIGFRPAKGEILTLRIDGLAEERIVSRGVWLMPVGNGLFRAGATYEWNDLSSTPTASARHEICERIREFLRIPFEVVGQDAAVRPILQRQYPVVTLHRDHPQLGFFNGLGSKGALQAPWLANHFTGFLLGENSLDQAVSGHLYDTGDAVQATNGSQLDSPSVRSAPAISLTEMAHSLIKTVLKPGDIAVDATVGNGHDTQFLATCVGPLGKVYGFDVQAVAISATRRRLEIAGLSNVELLQRSHAEMREVLSERCAAGVNAVTFNLGYLPSGDKAVITLAETTIAAMSDGLSLLVPAGIMTILAYTGHDGGNEEAGAVEDFLKNLPVHEFEIDEPIIAKGRRSAPRLFVVRKIARFGELEGAASSAKS